MRSRPHFTGVWLSDTEYGELLQLCRNSGLSASTVIRKQLLGETIKLRPPDCYAELLRVLSGISTNINQLAHRANSKGYVTQAQIHEAARLARQAWELVRETL